MSGAIPPLPQYAFMAWCSVKAQGQLYFYLFNSAVLLREHVFKVTANVTISHICPMGKGGSFLRGKKIGA
jgi:hypothetical protein